MQSKYFTSLIAKWDPTNPISKLEEELPFAIREYGIISRKDPNLDVYLVPWAFVVCAILSAWLNEESATFLSVSNVDHMRCLKSCWEFLLDKSELRQAITSAYSLGGIDAVLHVVNEYF